MPHIFALVYKTPRESNKTLLSALHRKDKRKLNMRFIAKPILYEVRIM